MLLCASARSACVHVLAIQARALVTSCSGRPRAVHMTHMVRGKADPKDAMYSYEQPQLLQPCAAWQVSGWRPWCKLASAAFPRVRATDSKK